jgi:hypothetical protein
VSSFVAQNPNKPVFKIPLSFEPNTTEAEVQATFGNFSCILYFNLNTVEASGSNLYLSCYTVDGTKVHFSSLRCVFGSYINNIDNGCLYKFFFLAASNDTDPFPTITFDSLNKGVNMYALTR